MKDERLDRLSELVENLRDIIDGYQSEVRGIIARGQVGEGFCQGRVYLQAGPRWCAEAKALVQELREQNPQVVANIHFDEKLRETLRAEVDSRLTDLMQKAHPVTR